MGEIDGRTDAGAGQGAYPHVELSRIVQEENGEGRAPSGMHPDAQIIEKPRGRGRPKNPTLDLESSASLLVECEVSRRRPTDQGKKGLTVEWRNGSSFASLGQEKIEKWLSVIRGKDPLKGEEFAAAIGRARTLSGNPNDPDSIAAWAS